MIFVPRIGKEETTILSNNISKGLFRTIKINFSSWVLLVPSLFIMFVILWQPIFSGFYLSLFKMKGYDPIQFVGLKNFFDVMSDGAFLQTLMNTFFYVIWSIVIGFLPPILIAVVLNEMVHFKSYFKFAVYFPSMVPGIAAALLWYFIFQPGDGGILNMLLSKIGIANSQWLQDAKMTIPLIVATMTWKGFGPAVILYMASLQGVGQDHYEAASISQI